MQQKRIQSLTEGSIINRGLVYASHIGDNDTLRVDLEAVHMDDVQW
jgi:hypothetical protein